MNSLSQCRPLSDGNQFTLTMYDSGNFWNWDITDKHGKRITSGFDRDPHSAFKIALVAFDEAVKKEKEGV